MTIEYNSYSGGRFPAYIVNTTDIKTVGNKLIIEQIMDTGSTIYDGDAGIWYIAKEIDFTTGETEVKEFYAPATK